MRHMIYRLNGEPNASVLTPEHFILTDPERDSVVSTEDPNSQLFWSREARHDAEWQQAIQALFPNAPGFPVELPAAVIITKVPTVNGDEWFGICYGHGHTLLNSEKIVRRWGLKVALNLICAGASGREFLRRVDSRIIRANSLIIARQASRPDSIDSFGINTQTDILRAITGQPFDEVWGSTVYGQDGVSILMEGNLSDAQHLLSELEEIHDKLDYQQRFGWVDHIFPIRDISLRSALFEQFINDLRFKNIGKLNLNTPEITDWGNSAFRIKGIGKSDSNIDPTLLEYLEILEQHVAPSNTTDALNALDALNIERLKQHRLVNVTNGDSWPLLHCIEGEILYNGKTYYFSDGQFLEIDSDFVAEVNAYLNNKIQPAERIFPNNNLKLKEEDYILQIGRSQSDLLIMDQKTIDGFPTATSKVELCDLLSDQHEFIHIKRGIRSSTFSHLVMQAQNSVEHFWRSDEFRNRAITKIQEIEATIQPTPPSRWSGSLSGLPPNDLDAHVIFAVTGNWNRMNFIERLPFFSRLSLRLAIQNLEGFSVTFESIMIEEN